MTSSFSWLHLSDLHAGMKHQSWMWPSLRDKIHEDLRYLISKHQSWDVVVFSGDLTQKGTPDEYEVLNGIIKELWQIFNEHGFSPKLFCVPGNHDLVRPGSIDPTCLALTRWWDLGELRADFWGTKGEIYRKTVGDYFSNYTNWLNELKKNGIPLLSGVSGTFPGDVSAVYEKDDFRVGFIGLNSTWLQVAAGDFKGKLHIDPRQLLEITDNNPSDWAKQNVLNFLVTHHPLDWLHSESLTLFNQDIDIGGRFDAHLYGHMHEPAAIQKTHLGALPKRSMQSASLFGLETFGNNIQRAHGYSFNSIKITDGHLASLEIWPRASRVISGTGERVMGPDMTLPINNDNYIAHSFELNRRQEPIKPAQLENKFSDAIISTEITSGELKANIENLIIILPAAPEAMGVRLVQQEQARKILTNSRRLWLAADWGMGENGFIWSTQKRISTTRCQFYKIDMSDYVNRSEFYQNIRTKYGFSFESLCGALATQQDSYLLFDDIPFTDEIDDALKLQLDLEELAGIVLSYCPALKVILRSRLRPPANDLDFVEITALDKADTRYFIENHHLGSAQALSPEDILRIYNHTDGLPNLIETDLRSLNVASLSEITTSPPGASASPAGMLQRAILELSESKDETLKRSYVLLKSLSVFSHGEELGRIKNFDKTKPVFFAHAQILQQRGLLYAEEIEQFDRGGGTDRPKRLIITRAAREWLHANLDTAELKRLNDGAAKLYFGTDWGSGQSKPPTAYRFDQPNKAVAEMHNARTIIMQIVTEAADNTRKLQNAMQLVSAHGAALLRGDYFKSAIELFDYILPMLQGKVTQASYEYAVYQHAKALRMIDGKIASEKAKEMLLTVLPGISDKTTKVSAYLNLAHCYNYLDQGQEAIDYAKKIISLEPRSSRALTANQIILENSEKGLDINSKLDKLEAKARKQNSLTVAFNIGFSRIKSISDPDQKADTLYKLVREAKQNQDHYNVMRGMIALGELATKGQILLTLQDKNELIKIYHYLYNEGFYTQFNKCHDILWHIFSADKEIHNLLQLYRYSSLSWRLRGKEEREMSSLKRLNAEIKKSPTIKGSSDISTAYFYARLGLLL
ncbi:metallophosphoesterase [Pseudomonas asiatica]|uniref:metallophosphoesterase n=1 Tax=Pseudomonas TaxID=286 RepID=UPI001BD3D291|nr:MULTISPECIES: metallophosphoesterase [Pseudomonas]MBS9761255.1 metallophosphoesterase [Pseudomonas mosselii]MEE1915120.1 metallophosphoesterase [Pseudomonas asiatica]